MFFVFFIPLMLRTCAGGHVQRPRALPLHRRPASVRDYTGAARVQRLQRHGVYAAAVSRRRNSLRRRGAGRAGTRF